MRIAHVSPVYPPKGGMGTVAYEYVEMLKERSEYVQIFTPDYQKAFFKWGNAALMPSLLWRLRKFDIIHLHYPFYGGALFAMIASLLWRVPLVMTYHMQTRGSGLLGWIFRTYRILIKPILFWRAKMVLVSSLDYAKSVKLTHRNLKELPFSVDVERFHPGVAQDLRKKKNISEATCVFLFVGGLDDAHYFKGVDVLLDAASQLPNNGWSLICVGGGNRLDSFRNRVKKLNLEHKVEFSGRVRDEMLAEYYRMSDVHILPSIDRSEAFGLVTLEAAASGLPSLVSDLPGVRTLVQDRVTGYYLTPGSVDGLLERMSWMISHEAECKYMGQKARQRIVANYAPRIIIDQLQELYRQVTVK